MRFSQAPGLRNVRLMQLQPDQFSETWLAFASADLQTTVEALRAQQRALVLPDWAVLQLVLKVARNEIGHSTTATAYSWYLLNQLGFDVRLGYNESKLVLLMAANVTVYGRPFFTIDGERYYRVDGGPANNLRIHTAGFPGHSGKLRLDFANQMRTPGLVESRQLRFVDGGRIASAVIQYDPHWVEYLNGHPAIDLHHYFSAKVFSTTANSLAAFWQTRIQQDSPQQAVNRLLHFVQNGFKYQTDDEQFGGERYLLPSESIHYNAIDCEDRSFLLAWLIRDLLGLPVIGLHYPGHVALAVSLPGEPVVGAATVDYEGRQYTVADPTYMGAALGQLMPQFEGVTPTILAVN
ncbi:hypothetical protein [Microbulbifer elongatus]|uniref:hypothetical protein n=1 Tax=Microbulbifer elongatus TaxID=86173 RepID=UPI00210EA9B2|nr:hypothetical protein [Microbulbifer elongatus]